jgi:signal transduction histidine kinase
MEISEPLLLQLEDLTRDLGDCHDLQSTFVVARRRLKAIFGEHATFSVLLTDTTKQSWRCLTLQYGQEHWEHTVTLQELPANMDLAQMLNVLGRDVTELVCNRSAARHLLIDQALPFSVTAEQPQGTLLDDLRVVTGAPLQGFLVSNQPRPLNRGRCVVVMGRADGSAVDDAELLLFNLAVGILARFTAFLSMYSWMVRLENDNRVLRRNIVHDLKTPVTVIKGCAELLVHMGEDAGADIREELLTCVSEQADRLGEELQEILSPPVDGSWTPHYEEFDLALLLHKVIASERTTVRARSHHFEIMGAEQPLMLRGDRRKLRRVLENLLSNAVKYSPSDGTRQKTVTISLETQNGDALVAFKDEGLGLTGDQLQRIFTAPGRVAAAHLNIEGSGFGLDSCRRVLEAHGGRLLAESQPGAGSTFTLRLPLWPPHEGC